MSSIDPNQIPTGRWTRPQLEYWILFSIAVAGKNAVVTGQKMQKFLECHDYVYPFSHVFRLIRNGELGHQLRRVRLGKYKLLNRGFRAAIKLDLDNLTLDSLQQVPGIGPKSARMILIYAFPEHADKWVPLDTHILHWLRDQGHKAPKTTPTGKTYLALEEIFRQEARKRNMTMRELDTKVWKEYSGNE